MITLTDDSRNQYRTGAFALLFTAILAVAMVGPALAAGPSDDLAYSGDEHAPNPYANVSDLTVAKHPMSEGATHADMAGYEDDSGDWVDDPVFNVNTTSSIESGENVNPYSFKPGHIEADFYGEFPRTDNDSETYQNASQWDTVSGSSNVTISETTVASGVDALQIDTTGTSNVDSGDTVAEVAYDNWDGELDSDESKRVLQVGADVDTLNGKVNISLEDESGDTKTVQLNSSASGQDVDARTAASGTGDIVYQIKLSQLSTDGGGSYDNIESVNVTVIGGNADISMSWLDAEKKSKTTLGEKKVDTAVDSDGEYDQTNTTYNATGAIQVYSMETLDAAYDDASVTDVSFPAKFPAERIEGEEGEENSYVYQWENASDYPNFASILNVSYRLHLPAPVDLSYGSVDLRLEQAEPSGRYIDAGHETDVGEDANLSDASLTDHSGSLASTGDDVQLASGLSSDAYHIVHYEVKYTSAEEDGIKAAAGSSGGSAPVEDDSGGFFSSVGNTIMAAIGGLLVFLGIRSRSGGS